MRRVNVPIKGAIPGDPRTGQSYFTKPGTPLDRVAKAERTEQLNKVLRGYGFNAGCRPATGNEQAARLARQAKHRQHLRYSAMPPVTVVNPGRILDGAMGLGPDY